MGYPPFACYDADVGYDRKRTEYAPSGDQLGWIECVHRQLHLCRFDALRCDDLACALR
jgi:hypothetical protein